MKKHEKSINSIIHDHLIGCISEQDRQQLQWWLDSSPANREKFERLVQESGLTEQIRLYNEVDEDCAWEKFQKRHFPVRQIRWAKMIRYAAILMLPVIGFSIWVYTLSERDAKPVVSHENRVAMIRSERLGKQKATLTLANGQKVDFQSSLSKSIQDSVVQKAPQVKQRVPAKAAQKEDKNKLVTYHDSEFWITFEDGTRVHLNYNTTLRYPSHFATNSRIVYLDGEAYFQIAKDSKRPFIVVTSSGIVKQYGTSFNVDTREGSTTKVVLVEGSVSVQSNQGEEHFIKPGEMAVLRATEQAIQVTQVDVSPYIAWSNGRFVFDNCSLENLMNVISHWYNKDIVFESEDIKQIPFTGDIDRYGSITPILKAIQHVTHLEMEVEGRNIIIRK